MKSIAVMQPYFLPYIGYFQLMAAVDTFVLFDDVNYINRGWINRNRMLLNGAAFTFTVPLSGASQNRLICDIELVDKPDWRHKMLRTFHQAYAKAPNYVSISGLLERIIMFPSSRLDEFLRNSLVEIANLMALPTRIVASSTAYQNAQLKGKDRIIDICRQEQARTYINLPGGVDLYERGEFAAVDVKLKFLKPRLTSYLQGQSGHVPGLSIIDVLMFNSVPSVRHLLTERDYF